MKVSYKQMRVELIEYLKAYNALDLILKMNDLELETLYKQVTKPRLIKPKPMEGEHDGLL